MRRFAFLLGQLQSLNPLNPAQPLGKAGGLLLRDILLIVATGLALTMVLVLWARWYVKNRRHRRHEHRSTSTGVEAHEPAAEPSHHHHHHHRHRRRRRRRQEYRTRNPTLAETGGLPPIRTNQPPGPPA